jgi:NAD(P)-dependent dehydrogenase (short-subunit alcohol dehydrogenase family)
LRVLVLGGTGVFGSRLCRLLAGDPAITLSIAARNGAAVDAMARQLGVAGLAFDWRSDLDRVLGEGGHDAVVHTAGPFQGQGHGVAELCIRHRVHYLDLSDDAAFVRGIDRLNEAALQAGVLVCSGASTAPAITGAVVEEALKSGPVERVDFGIMPGNDAPRGPALVAAILGGAGKPIDDQPGRRVWGGLRRMALPGLGRRWVAPCDLPEPALFARRYGIRDTFAGAGLELSVLHVGLWLLSWLVRRRLVASLAPAAPLLARIADHLRFLGTDRGGLRLELRAGPDLRVWSLIAEGGDGPFIPVTPAAALVRKLARGDVAVRGAMPCLGLLTLAEIESEWRQGGLRVATGWGEGDVGLRPSVYRRVLGAAYDRQSRAGQALHDAGPSRWQGRCSVEGASSAAGRLVARLFQLPAPAEDAPITVEFATAGSGEAWTRRIGGRVMRSRQFIGLRKPAGWIVERFGLFEFDLELRVAGERLALLMRGMRCCGLPLPRALWPRTEATESERDGRFCFDVEIGLPLVGRLVRYRGWLTDR